MHIPTKHITITELRGMADLEFYNKINDISIAKFGKNKFTESTELTLLHSEKPKLYTILAFLSAIGLKHKLKQNPWRP